MTMKLYEFPPTRSIRVRWTLHVALAGEEFTATAGVLERHMRRRQFVVGDGATVADFVLAYTLDWGNELRLLGGFPELLGYMKRMYARPKAPPRIAEAFAAIRR